MKRRTKWIVYGGGGAVVILLIIAKIIAGGSKQPVYETATVERREIVQQVSVTGKVKAAEEVELGFERVGKVAQVSVKVGDKVTVGQVLVSQDSADIGAQYRQAQASIESAQAQLLQAQASLATQQAKLEELQRGTRPEELAITQAKVTKARQDLTNYYNSIGDVLHDTESAAVDAVNNKTDAMFIDDASSNPKISFSGGSSQYRMDAESQRLQMTVVLQDISQTVRLLPVDAAGQEATLEKVKGKLSLIRTFLNTINLVVNSTSSLGSDTASAFQADLAAGLSLVNGQVTAISSLQQNLAAQKITVQQVERELALAQAGTPAEQITAQESAVRSAQANVAAAQAAVRSAQASAASVGSQVASRVIRAPFAGTITKQDAKVGEIISANDPVVGLISDGKYQIEANIPEIDIATLAVGNTANVTLDAYGSDVVFAATVVALDPAETLVEGVATYKTTLLFDQPDERVRSGMTANINIIALRKADVLVIPQRAVTAHGSARFVRTFDAAAATTTEVEVHTGVRGSDGTVEILDGLQEGQVIVTGEKK